MNGLLADRHRKYSAAAKFAAVAIALLLAHWLSLAVACADNQAVEARLAEAAKYLASEECEGRGIGSKGIKLAAQYIAQQFATAGLKTDLADGRPFQNFSLTAAATLGKDNKLALYQSAAEQGDSQHPNDAQRLELKLGADFTPLSLSKTGEFDLPLVFVGYGIKAEQEGYDDYAGIDVAGKAVVVLRREPRQDDPNSPFDGTRDSRHALLTRKINVARDQKAAAVVLVTDEFDLLRSYAADRRRWEEALDKLTAEHEKFKKVAKPTLPQLQAHAKQIEELTQEVAKWGKRLEESRDTLMAFRAGGPSASKDVFVVHCRREVIDRAIRASLGTDLSELERFIDETLKPQSRHLEGWRISGKIDIVSQQVELSNVIAVLEGEGPTAEETIVVGAHYDHLGRGSFGSLSGTKEIHPGADDNASGTAGLIALAHLLAGHEPKLKRRVVFVAFTAEESGLIGSTHYVQNPPFPLDKTVAMINLDMIGRMSGEKLSVMGYSSGDTFGDLLDRINEKHKLKLTKSPRSPGGSDHLPFFRQGIPVMFFTTGMHPDYHRTSDTFERLNIVGMRQVVNFVADVIVEIANAPQRPKFVGSGAAGRPAVGGGRPILGVVPDPDRQGEGVIVSGVVVGGPADRAGMKTGDTIIEFAGQKIGGLADLENALEQCKAGQKVRAVVRREGKTLELEVNLEGAPQPASGRNEPLGNTIQWIALAC